MCELEMRRYWYKTKKPNKISGKREMRVFTHLPHGYDVYLGEVIRKDENGHFIHTLYDRQTSRIVAQFDDHGNCGFSCSRDTIEKALDPMLRDANQLRKQVSTHSNVKLRKVKRRRK
jgi:hypothetical protein